MFTLKAIHAIAGAMVLFGACSAVRAEKQPNGPQTELNVSMEMAMAIVGGAIERCAKDGYRVSVVVVDKAGQVSASLRGDGTPPHTVEFARMKAYTSRVRGQTSLEFAQLASTPEGALLRQIPGVVAIGGGIPIKVRAETIGGVGVSGAPSGDRDEACAAAGLAKITE